MKSLRYILIISIFTSLGINEIMACVPEWYYPKEYYMYRVYDQNNTYKEALSSRNCQAWQEITSQDIPVWDIYEVVYSMPLEELDRISRLVNYRGKNQFIEWITKNDRSILDFLHVAKANEYIRFRINSEWYYPTMDIDAPMSLEEIINHSLADTSKLRDRYLLQAVRALHSTNRFEEIVALWNNEIKALPKENLMREMIMPYVAGAMSRIPEYREQGIQLFIQLGDIDSMLYCLGQQNSNISRIDLIRLIFDYDPNSPEILERLQQTVIQLEDYYNYNHSAYRADYYETQLTDLLELALKATQDRRVTDPAVWYYTAALLYDLIGNTQMAYTTLCEGEKLQTSQFLKESMQVMHIYLDAKTKPYDSKYEELLLEQLNWLDDKIINNITPEVERTILSPFYLKACYSFYYWNDMMRRIVLAEICPRLIEQGETTKALQLANMASYHLLQVINKAKVTHTYNKHEYKQYGYNPIVLSLDEYRRYPNRFNEIDYSNHFFIMANTIGAEKLEAYRNTTLKPKSKLDRFTNKRSYISNDYLCDIIGTLYLREMNYTKAKEYFKQVSPQYEAQLNIALNDHPFEDGHRDIMSANNFRYEFASTMDKLEKDITNESDHNEKARLIITYAEALRSSYKECWQLTQYYFGYMSFMESEKNDSYEQQAYQRYKQLINEAYTTAKDANLKADILYKYAQFKTIVELYPNTQKGRTVRGECDQLIDYNNAIEMSWKYWH